MKNSEKNTLNDKIWILFNFRGIREILLFLALFLQNKEFYLFMSEYLKEDLFSLTKNKKLSHFDQKNSVSSLNSLLFCSESIKLLILWLSFGSKSKARVK